jgi:GTPase
MTKASFIAISGSPNVGKSTLLNKIIGDKISIVSPKVQTTRSTLNGIYNQDDTQLVFVDTPGIFTPTRPLEEAIVNAAWTGLQGLDMILLVIDSVRGICADTQNIIDAIHPENLILILNKKDLVTTEKLNRLITALEAMGKFKKIFSISAIKNEGVKGFLDYLIKNSPASPWYYPEDQITTSPVRLLASEVTREKLFLALSDELPYHLTVETESWEEKKDGSVKINQSIFVSRDGHKQIVLGSNGQMIKKIGTLARLEIEKLLDCKVHLFLFVKVRENWFTDPERYKYLGMQPPKTQKKKRS